MHPASTHRFDVLEGNVVKIPSTYRQTASPNHVREPCTDVPTDLCSNCAALDLCTIVHRDVGPRSEILLDVDESLGLTSTSDGCSLCRLKSSFRAVMSFGHDYERLCVFRHIPGRSSPVYLQEEPDEVAEKSTALKLARSVAKGTAALNLDGTGRARSAVDVPHASKVDLNLFKHVIERCEIQHQTCVKVSTTDPQALGIRVIDCWAMAVLDLPLGAKYATLSYCWGISQDRTSSHALFAKKAETLVGTKSRSHSNKLLATLPATIKDALLASRELGLRYLWIDRYCVPLNRAERDLTISLMDQIYENSSVTLVALHGKDANAGLPGVSNLPRSPHLRGLRIHGRILAVPPPQLTEIIGKSHWNSRAWTYQEARLSRRCLFFTERQTYFVCRSTSCSESLIRDPLSDPSCAISPFINSFRLETDLFSPSTFYMNDQWTVGPFIREIKQYAMRDLTFQADRLNAFRGLLRRSPYLTYWGIPIFPDDSLERYTHVAHLSFACGLAWSRNDSLRFEKVIDGETPFPTWSWAACPGVPDFLPGESSPRLYLEDGLIRLQPGFSSSTCRFWVHEPTGQEITLATAVEGLDPPSSVEEHVNRLYIDADVYEAHIGKRSSRNQYLIKQHGGEAVEGYWQSYLDSPLRCYDGEVSLVHLLSDSSDPRWETCLIVEWTNGRETQARRIGLANGQIRLKGVPFVRRRFELI